MRRSLVMLICALPTAVIDAQDIPRPRPELFNQACSDIEMKGLDMDKTSPFTFSYERTFWEMAGAKPGVDSLSSAIPKVRRMWKRYALDFQCTTAGLQDGNILRYAVEKHFLDFIDDIVTTYGLDINFVDPRDGQSLLDWVRGREALHDSQRAEYAKTYETLRRKYGAKLASEVRK